MLLGEAETLVPQAKQQIPLDLRFSFLLSIRSPGHLGRGVCAAAHMTILINEINTREFYVNVP
jgi:hypothetical protein